MIGLSIRIDHKAVHAATGTPPPVAGTLLAAEGGTFVIPDGTTVAWGADTRWYNKLFAVGGTYTCDQLTMDDQDPAFFTVKSCRVGPFTG